MKGGNYFNYFHQRGAINRGMAIIQGNMVCLRWDSSSLLLKTTTNAAKIFIQSYRLIFVKKSFEVKNTLVSN